MVMDGGPILLAQRRVVRLEVEESPAQRIVVFSHRLVSLP
jgi:hypothetical protein